MMMKQKHWLISMTTAVAIFAAGCGGIAQDGPAPAAPQSPSAGSAAPGTEESRPTGVAFEVIKESMLPAELNSWKELTQPPKSTGSARVGDYLYVLVTGGMDSVGASAIAVKQVVMAESHPPVFLVTAAISPGKSGNSFPKSYIRIPYPASEPVPGVIVKAEWLGAKAEPTKPAIDPNTPVSSPAQKETATTSPQKPVPAEGLTLTPIPASALPASLAAWKESTVNAPTGVSQYVDGTLYLMVAGGERNSGGYAVEIKSVEMQEGLLHVSAVLHSPKPGQMVTQAITYPKTYAKINLPGSGEPGVVVTWK